MTETMTTRRPEHETKDANRDPITGAPGSHPVGTGVGAASGGVAGAAIGAVGGPVGALVGGAIGAIAGGMAGHAIGEQIDPTYDDSYFRETHEETEWATSGEYDRYSPAYQYGWTARRNTLGSDWDEHDSNMEREWNALDGTGLTWDEARPAARHAWNRADGEFSGLLDDEDEYWQENYRTRDYVGDDEPYESYRDAYRFGAENRTRYMGQKWEDVENDLERGWDKVEHKTTMGWNRAKNAVRDGWHNVERALPGDFDNDGR